MWSRNIFVCLSVLGLSLLATSPVRAQGYLGKAVAVQSGDTIRLVRDGAKRAATVRLSGINTPEVTRPFGKKAKEFTKRLVLGKQVYVEPMPTDNIAVIRVGGAGGKNLNAELVRVGLAWCREMRLTRMGSEVSKAENEARAARRGLWAARKFLLPDQRRELERQGKPVKTP